MPNRSDQSESVLERVDMLLDLHELVLLRMGGDEDEAQSGAVTLQLLEDVVDVATVIADNLGGTCVHITGVGLEGWA
jgi:hypothetical protein